MKAKQMESGWYFVKMQDSDGEYYWQIASFFSGDYWEKRLPFSDGLGMRFGWERVRDVKKIKYPKV